METYPPDYGGGAALTARELCHYLAATGHGMRVLCAGDISGEEYSVYTEYDGPIQINRISLPYFKKVDPEGWRLGLFRWLKHQKRIAAIFNKLLMEWRPDIAIYHTSRPFGEVGYKVINSHGIPIVAVLHEGWLICPRNFFLQSPFSNPCDGPDTVKCLACMYSHYDGSMLKFTLKLPWRVAKLNYYLAYRVHQRASITKLISGAAGVSEFLAKHHRPFIRGEVIALPRCIDTTGISSEEIARIKRPRNPLRFGFVAGVQPVKGIWHVLDAAKSLKEQGRRFELHVWGPGQESGLAEISSRGLEDFVILRGMYSPEKLWNVYGEMDVAIMATTVCESLGRVPLEAAAAGAPTIAPAIGGLTEIIRHGVDGLLYEFMNVKDLEKQMRRVIDEPGLIEQLIRNLKPLMDGKIRGAVLDHFCRSILSRKFDPAVSQATPL